MTPVAWIRIRGDDSAMDSAADNHSRWSTVHLADPKTEADSHGSIEVLCGKTTPRLGNLWGPLEWGPGLLALEFWGRRSKKCPSGVRRLKSCPRCAALKPSG